MEVKTNIYTELGRVSAPLPTAPPQMEDCGESYRLQKINEIQQLLDCEREKRQKLSKKYHRGVNVINTVDSILVTASMGLGIAGVGLLSTIIAAPVVIAMEGTALGAGCLSIFGKYISRKLYRKAEKHTNIQVLAEAKLNTISDHISKALTDGKVSDDEFTLILSEMDKFREMKNEIGRKAKTNIDEEMKNSLIQQGRNQARESFRKFYEKSRH